MYTNNKKHNYNKNNLKNSWEKNATREKREIKALQEFTWIVPLLQEQPPYRERLCPNSLVALPESDKYG
ncbi:MAG: hypothetical protein EF811_02775 [Methanonatronarchaeia archaeon]|nr:MAG: hypothetical protein EF811_02775 [Methanonatronarchaeia archaeon]